MKTFKRNVAVKGVMAAMVAAVFAVPVQAQDYPSQPIKFVVGFSAGGFADTMGRIVAQGVSERLGQPVVVENKGGASGNIAAASVASSEADGYTVLVTTSSLGLSQSLGNALEYSIDDLAAVAIPVSSAETLAAHPSVPATNVAELVEWAKEQESVTIGIAGVGTGSQVAMSYFLTQLAGLDNILEVGYKGGSKARQAAISGEVQLVGSSNSVYPVIREGLLNGIGVAAAEPISALPDTQTFAGQGFDGFVAASWVGLFVPAGTDPAIQEALNAAVNDLLSDPEAVAKFEKAGVMMQERGLGDTQTFFTEDTAGWAKMIDSIGLGS